jgi:hypothetical protein
VTEVSWPDLELDPINLLNVPGQSEFRLITHVAIKYDGKIWALPKPNRHHHIVRMIGGTNGPDTQGFLDDKEVFLNRREAYELAIRTGQIARCEGGYTGNELFSEDLW